MNKRFYPRLALKNLGKNRRFWLPYLLTVMGTVAAFYSMSTTTHVEGIEGLGAFAALNIILPMGVFVVALVSGLFLLYTNSFLMKQRAKEFALYSVLGMSKGNIARVLFWETVYTALMGVSGGLVLGIVFDRLLLMILCRLVGVSYSGPVVYGGSAGTTAAIFVIFLFVTFLINSGRVGLSQPIALLYGGNRGEREPKARWLLALLGLAALGAGYYIALVTKSPLQALAMFFVAVLLVIAGTFLLFLAGSVAMLKLMRKNKRYYYRTRRFISVSGLMYRMKRNAAGLAIICILSTMVLVMMSSTVTLYAGMEDMVGALYPREFVSFLGSGDPEAWQPDPADVLAELEERGFHPQRVQIYDSLGTSGLITEDGISCEQRVMASGWDVENDVRMVIIFPADDYAAATGQRFAVGHGELYIRNVDMESGGLDVFGRTFTVMGTLPESEITRYFESEYAAVGSIAIVVAREDFYDLYQRQSEAYGDYASKIATYLNFDLPKGESREECFAAILDARHAPEGVILTAGAGYREETEASLRLLLGGLLYLGIFLGILFLAGTVLIIYYKQLSEGYEDQDRFEILQKVGMSRREIAGAIRSQVLLVFFLPLGTAALHMAAATPMILRLLRAFQFTNTGLFIGCVAFCAAVFALIYTAVYAVTARTYYGVVSRR